MAKKKVERCIYCLRRGKMTDEEVFAKWLRPYLPLHLGPAGTIAGAMTGNKLHEVTWRKQTSKRSRYSRYVHAVCGPCNNGWMSQLQKRIKPILLPMIQGKATQLLPEQQEQLAAWTSMTTMTSDYGYHLDWPKYNIKLPIVPDPVCTQNERTYLKDNRKAPENWRIWIGRIEPEPDLHYSRQYSVALFPEGEADWLSPSEPIRADHPNTQATYFYLGAFYAIAISSAVPSIYKNWQFPRSRMRRRLIEIWPPQAEPVDWPPAFVIYANTAKAIFAAPKRYADTVKERTHFRRTPPGR